MRIIKEGCVKNMSSSKSEHKLIGILFAAVLLLLGGVLLKDVTAVEVAAATKKTGFVKEGGYTYYYDANGKVHKGWLKLGKKTYYFTSGKGVMVTGWIQDSKGNKRYFKKSGVMATGWTRFSAGKRYFTPSTGVMRTGWLRLGSKRYYLDKSTGFAKSGFQKISGKYRYFYSSSCALARGWLTNSKGEKRYFMTSGSASSDGVMATGFTEIDGDEYYFYTNSGKMATGWVTNTKTDEKYYFDPDSGKMVTGTVTIDGKTYVFDEDGTYQGTRETETGSDTDTGSSSSSKTIKNYLRGAFLPIAKALYVWGGGWADSTRKGLSDAMTQWYNTQSSGYDYHGYGDITKGFDCSGFVGWATYQVMHKTSGEGDGYTVVSGEVGGLYKSLGWGSIINQNYLSSNGYVLKAGDIGFNSGHVWIVVGQCRDGSVVLVHSTPSAGVQLSATNTPSGGWGSQALALATKYMEKLGASPKYKLITDQGNMIQKYDYFRWNRSTLADPDGYMSMTADEILADLLGS